MRGEETWLSTRRRAVRFERRGLSLANFPEEGAQPALPMPGLEVQGFRFELRARLV